MFRNKIFIVVMFLSVVHVASAQSIFEEYLYHIRDSLTHSPIYMPQYLPISEDSVYHIINKLPSFGQGRDNYFITGIATNKRLSERSSDIKYQVSIRQRLLKKLLPAHAILLFTYTQKSFWNVYENSSPFKDNNYNPSIGVTKFIVVNGSLRGSAFLFAEHESNGKDSIDSRSWNFISFAGIYFFNPQVSLQFKAWLPFVGEGNTDLLDYRGLGMCAVNVRSRNERVRASLILNPHLQMYNCNTTIDLNFKIFRNTNQFLFIQYYYGYAEGLLNYNRFTSMLRVGICMKQNFLTFY